MREIKFRAWDKELKKFSDLALDSKIRDIRYLTDYEWLQYIGLKDVNGKEIYDGDIVDATYCIDGCLYYSEDEYGIVVRDDKKCGFCIKFDDEVDTTPISYYSYFEVIGNIYENPELLNQ